MMRRMTKDWQRLAEAAARRRAELGLTQAQVAQRGPLSLDRVQNIEHARRTRYRMATLVNLERALEWQAGSVEKVLSGGEPAPLEQDDTHPADAPAVMDPAEARIRAMPYLTDAERDFYVSQLRLAEEQARRRADERRREAEGQRPA